MIYGYSNYTFSHAPLVNNVWQKGWKGSVADHFAFEIWEQNFLQSLYSKKKSCNTNGHDKNARTALKNCLHHWPVRKNFLH